MQRNVFKVQKRIYQASQRDDVKTVREFQRLLMNSRSAKLLTVRKVTQDNRGKGTAGVDGVKALTPPQRLKLAHTLSIGHKARAVRRVLDHCELFPTERGTMQGGTISPLLANVALHGMEELLAQRFPAKSRKCFYAPRVIRYADDLVVLHKDHAVIEQCQELLAEWLQNMGLELKPSKTRITHTRIALADEPGFVFLGFNIRQYPQGRTKAGKDSQRQSLGFKLLIKPSKHAVKRHVHRLGETVCRYQHKDQMLLIRALNSLIIGWSRYYSTVVSQDVFEKVEYALFARLLAWAKRRHPKKGKWWIVDQYWRITKGQGWRFQPPGSDYQLYRHSSTPIRRHVKVRGGRSPYDGDWLYWSTRLGKHPEVPLRVTRLLKRQRGRCPVCELFFKDGDVIQVVHIVPKDGSGVRRHQQLLHRHCDNAISVSSRKIAAGSIGIIDKDQVIEEPDEPKGSRPVLKPSGGGDSVA